jgi:predicted TPR repeat methyltransferase
VSGFDISQNGVDYAREKLNLDVRNEDFLKYDFHDEQFDVVCLWDTIEHLRDPHLYLEKAGGLMTRGGLIAITTGDIQSLNARWRKEKWRLLHPPTHLHFFSKKSINGMLKRYGFEVIYNKYCGFYRSLDNMAYNLLILRNKKKFIYDFLNSHGLTRSDIYLNLYDIFYVVARKI